MRSKLFVPGTRQELFAKAFHGPADAISLDLEDSVSPEQKGLARENIAAWLERLSKEPGLRNGKTVIVRINPSDSPDHQSDLDLCAHACVDIINLPKPQSAADVRQVSAELARRETAQGLPRRIGLLLNIETARSLRIAAELATADARVVGLQLGLADLFEPAGIARHERAAVEQAMFLTRLAASEAGVYAYDTAYADIKNAQGFLQEAQLSRRMGFIGKSCIHPSQVALANTAFQPTEQEIDFARRVIAAAEQAQRQGQGVCVVDGKMIDAPFVQRARATLSAATQASSN